MATRPRRVVPTPYPVEPWFRRFPGVEGFLEAAGHEPWEDAHRLILADWLEDHGETARGEFLRLQVHIAAGARWTRSRDMDKRAHELETRHQEHWLAGMPAEATFDRGLVSGVRLEGDQYEITRTLRRASDAMDVQSLTLDPKRTALISSGWQVLFAEAVRLQVCALRLADFSSGARLEHSGLQALAGTHGLIHLRHLFLNDSNLREAATVPLGEANLPHLTHLHLGRNPIGTQGARILTFSPVLANVTHLNLAGCGIGDDGALALLASPHLRNLVQLSLRNNAISYRALYALARADGLAKLTHLDLSENRLTPQSVVALAESRALPSLAYLNLTDNEVSAEGYAALRASPQLPRLATVRGD